MHILLHKIQNKYLENNSIAYCKTPIGTAKLIANASGLQSVKILDKDYQAFPKEIPKNLKKAVKQLTDYFYNGLTNFQLKLNPMGTKFQLKVWKLLQQIPYGKTISYLELSQRYGEVEAIRAIAHANAKNPLWIIIPCHRVIGKYGDLTGYAGGLWRKKYLLELEQGIHQTKLF